MDSLDRSRQGEPIDAGLAHVDPADQVQEAPKAWSIMTVQLWQHWKTGRRHDVGYRPVRVRGLLQETQSKDMRRPAGLLAERGAVG